MGLLQNMGMAVLSQQNARLGKDPHSICYLSSTGRKKQDASL